MSRPSKARPPVLNLGTFLSVGRFFSASCVLEGYECQSPGDSSELPGYLDTSLLPPKKSLSTIYMATHIRFLSDPPRPRYSARELQPWKLDSCVQTRSCRIGKARPCSYVLNKSTRAKSRGGYLCGEVRVCSICTRRASFSNPPRQTQTPFSRYMRHLRVEARSCMVCKGPDQGTVEGGKCNKVYSTYRSENRNLPRSTPRCGLRAISVTGSCLGPR